MNSALTQRMSQHLLAGFALLIVLMVCLIWHAVWQFGNLKERMRDIVELRNQKIELATDLQEASYKRHDSLVYQVLARDPFERDDYFQQYTKWGYQVGMARSRLKSLPLDEFERANLQRQDLLIAQIISQQEQISDLAVSERLDAARGQLVEGLRPLNLAYTELVEALRGHERDLVRAEQRQTQKATQDAISLHLGLGGLMIILAVLISATTRSLIRRHAAMIYAQMSQLEEAGAQLEHEATHDALTGLANRSLFSRRLEESIVHAKQEGFSLVILYVDLDDFKPVNDLYGHAVGDILLKEVATRLRNVLRVSDTAARLGGDEFAVLFVGILSDGDCVHLCGKVEQEVSLPLIIDGLTLTPACSIGYAIFPDNGTSLDTLLKTADARMYESKREKKECHRLKPSCPG